MSQSEIIMNHDPFYKIDTRNSQSNIFFKFFCEKPYKGHDIKKSHFKSNEMA